MDGQSVEAANPANIAAKILDAPKMHEQWEARHGSDEHESPVTQRAQEIFGFFKAEGEWENGDWKSALAKNPDHLKLLQEFIALQRGTLHSRLHPFAVGHDQKDIKAGLDVLAADLASILPEEDLPKLADLPKDMQDILHLERVKTAQNPTQPVRSAARGFGKFLHHLDHEVWEHRHTVAPAAAIMGYVTYLVVSSFGVSGTSYTPEDATYELPSIESALSGCSTSLTASAGEGCDETVTLFTPQLMQGCHGHLAPFVFGYEPAVNLLIDMGAANILGPDCSTLVTYGENAKDFLLKGYDANLNRHDETIGNPVQQLLLNIEDFGASAAEDPELARQLYREGLEETIDNTVEAINKYDVYENLILHGGITALVGILTAVSIGKNGMPTPRTAASSFARATRGTWNFGKRVARNTPLIGSGALAGTLYPAQTNYFWQGDPFTGNLNPDVVLYALAGAMIGATVEKTYRYTQRRNHVTAMTADVSEQLKALSDSQIIKVQPPEITHKKSLVKPALMTAFATAATYVAIKADFALTNGQLTQHTLGTGLPILGFLASNPITDIIAHKGFAVAGGIFGVVGGTVILTTNYVGNAFREKENRIGFWRVPKEERDHHHHKPARKGVVSMLFEKVSDNVTKPVLKKAGLSRPEHDPVYHYAPKEGDFTYLFDEPEDHDHHHHDHGHHHHHDCDHDGDMTLTQATYRGSVNAVQTLRHMYRNLWGKSNFERAVKDYVENAQRNDLDL